MSGEDKVFSSVGPSGPLGAVGEGSAAWDGNPGEDAAEPTVRQCEVEGCDGVYYAMGFCRRCYMRDRRVRGLVKPAKRHPIVRVDAKWARSLALEVDEVVVERLVSGLGGVPHTTYERREAVRRLASLGYTKREIARRLAVHDRQVYRDLARK